MATRHSYKLARLRRLSPLTWRPRAVTWSRQPLTDTAPPPVQRGPSVRTRPPRGIYDAATNPSLSRLPVSPSLSLPRFPPFRSVCPRLRPRRTLLLLPPPRFPCTARSLSFPLSPRLCLSLPAFSSSLRRRLKYLHGSQMKRYCAESLDYSWSNTWEKSVGEESTRVRGCNCRDSETARTAHSGIPTVENNGDHRTRAEQRFRRFRYELFNPGSREPSREA